MKFEDFYKIIKTSVATPQKEASSSIQEFLISLENILRNEKDDLMVIDEVSPRKIRNYLHRWVTWWVSASETWQYSELLQQFLDRCWDEKIAAYAAILFLSRSIKKSRTAMRPVCLDGALAA